ncbi:MAG: hypothetical protein JNM85_07140 [Chthonomonas sp.]|nr:hypothetical protein [Chthonomonas sp.]
MKSSTAPQPIVLNGSYGEGGAALFRTALALSALTSIPVRVHNIRGATRKPGLSSEDLTFVRALEAATHAALEGDELRSSDLKFEPKNSVRPLTTRLDVQEHEKGSQPGNALIIAESVLPVLARAGSYSKLLIHGETYNANTLTFDSFERTTLAAHRRQGLCAFPRLQLAGFGYASAGEMVVEVEPSAFLPIHWDRRGEWLRGYCVVTTGGLQEGIGERGAEFALKLARERGLQLEVEHLAVEARSPGAYVSVGAEFQKGFGSAGAMGARGVRIEHVVTQAFDEFEQWLKNGATTDPYLADQLLIGCVLSGEPCEYSTSRLTQRLITMAWVIKQFMPVHITLSGREGEPSVIKVSA